MANHSSATVREHTSRNAMNVDDFFKLQSLRNCVLLLVAVISLYSSITQAQDRSDSVFDTVPLDSRGRLIERLKEYVSYERTRQYEKLYELISDLDYRKTGKEDYSKSRLELEKRLGVVKEFTPTHIMNVTLNDSAAPTFSLIGRAKVLRKGRTVEKQMTMTARLQQGEWYFSGLSNSYLHLD